MITKFNHSTKTVFAILAATLFSATSLRAQLVNDSANLTLNNVTSAIPGTVTIGTNGSFTLLTLSDNAFLTNTINGVIGRNAGARSNEVRLVSSSARWRMGGSLFVGSNGASSRLVVSNGAFVENQEGLLGRLPGSSNNLALVTGGGSVWSNRDNLYIGSSGPENRLVVSNGGLVFCATGVMGRDTGANNNNAVVTGNGSVWTNALDLLVGNTRPGNRLAIEAGGRVSCGDEFYLGGSASSQNNEVLVTDPGSLLSARFLTVGLAGNFNRLVVSNGAAVRSLSDTVGGSSSFNNQVVVTGLGSTWSNLGLTIGSGSTGHRVEVSDGGRVATGGSTVGYSISGGNTVLVRDSSSVWNNQGNLTVGDIGSGNMFVASNGATVLSSNATIGTSSAPSFGVGGDNLALITGAGTLWSNRETFTVGSLGTSNRLMANDGALVKSVTGILGGETNGNLNSIILSDPGTRWLLGFSLYVGSNGSLNRFVLTNGAFLESDFGAIGSGLSSTNNEMTVTGGGSTWHNNNFILVGDSGRGNRLVITNGGHVRSGNAEVGLNPGSLNNEALIVGPGSLWTVDSWIAVGGAGSGNRLAISSGAEMLCGGSAYIGTGGTNNEVLVTGAGSSMINQGPLIVGHAPFRGDNRLLVTNGGLVSATDVIIGNLGSTNNRVIVDGGNLLATIGTFDVQRGTNVLNAGLVDTGAGLLLTNTQGFFEFNGGTLITRGAVISNNNPFIVGKGGNTPAVWEVRGPDDHVIADGMSIGVAGSFAQLIHTNGVWLTNDGPAFLGVQAASRSNSATVSGPGTRWWLSDGLVVGSAGSDNRLTLRDGGSLVTASISYLGQDISSGNNEARVNGPGTVWNSGATYGMRVGERGRNNRLLVENGALLVSGPSSIGETSTASNNLASIAGAGSRWDIAQDLHIGKSGSQNLLTVSNGAMLTASGRGIVGTDTNSLRNSVWLTGGNAVWIIASNLLVGSNGAFNQLVISNGARLAAFTSLIGAGAPSSNNTVLVTGPNSEWNNADRLFLGNFGAGNQLVISNGGRVTSSVGEIGVNVTARNNQALVTGPGSVWHMTNSLSLGENSSGNRMVVSDGGVVRSSSGFIGLIASSSNNFIHVTGPGSEWTSTFNVALGASGPGTLLVVSNGGVASAGNGLFLGLSSNSLNNRVVIEGGTLRSTNFLGSSAYDIRRGTNVLNGGLVEADLLLLTNSQGFFELNAGTLRTRGTVVDNGKTFIVGTGTSVATLQLAGNGTHSFAAQLFVGAEATLTGNGDIIGVAVHTGGSRLSPGSPIGKISYSPPPVLAGLTVMEISKDAGVLTNDQILVTGTVNYGGSLIVTNRGSNSLASGDRFVLFTASGHSGSFNNVTLPSLPAGLNWTNKLLVDGSIEVISVTQPGFGNISRDGTNLIFSGKNGAPGANYTIITATNVTLPASNWLSILTNQFGAGGEFSFTNGIIPEEPERYFRLRTP